MFNDLAVLEAQQVESNRRSGVTSDAFVSGMQQDEVSVHECAVDCYVGSRRARYFGGKRLHSNKTISEVRIMLYERFGKVPIDCSRIFLANDVNHGLASVGAQSVRGRPQIKRCFGRRSLGQARAG